MFFKLIFYTVLLITFDIMIYLFHNKKYRGYLDLKHYFTALKMPIYQKTLIIKILIMQVFVVFFTCLGI
ncbi:hypothetical protein [Cetobacterium sp. SF1]|uniref:hypothetical protein n=1 Tax=Cetobacterium sp. SF1 TaxID=3417654 RepID=UPI003CE71185